MTVEGTATTGRHTRAKRYQGSRQCTESILRVDQAAGSTDKDVKRRSRLAEA